MDYLSMLSAGISWLRQRKTQTSPQIRLADDSKNGGSSKHVTMVCVEYPRSLYYVVGVLLLGLVLLIMSIQELKSIQLKQHHPPAVEKVIVKESSSCEPRPVVWIHGKKLESGYLKHVFAVFERLGYKPSPSREDWKILWSHEYPFSELGFEMAHLKPHQRVNHFPGTGYITSKVSLATGTSLKHIPMAFRVPKQKGEFLKYVKAHPEKLWVQKSNSHRGIVVKKSADVDLSQEGTFIQEYITNPLLIDGKKFDVGVYVTMTSIDPLRVYIYEGDALLRFCTKSYNPFNVANIDSYVIGDDYLPTWEVPSLKEYFTNQSLTMKESLNLYLRQKGKNPYKIWNQIREAIASVYFEKEFEILRAVKKYSSSRNFFEMVRFDFVVDDELNVYLMEANMSPNLSSAHFPANKLLYEQVIFNVLSLLGLSRVALNGRSAIHPDEELMQVSDKDIQAFPSECTLPLCKNACIDVKCKFCNWCLSEQQRVLLKETVLEHLNRMKCRRVIPLPVKNSSNVTKEFSKNPSNYYLAVWFEGKCHQDFTWCS